MSYCRFIEADCYVYEYEHTDGGGALTCADCRLSHEGHFDARRKSEMIAHLERHQEAGHRTGTAIERLREELDTEGDALT